VVHKSVAELMQVLVGRKTRALKRKSIIFKRPVARDDLSFSLVFGSHTNYTETSTFDLECLSNLSAAESDRERWLKYLPELLCYATHMAKVNQARDQAMVPEE
jgi:hypothetical protein